MKPGIQRVRTPWIPDSMAFRPAPAAVQVRLTGLKGRLGDGAAQGSGQENGRLKGAAESDRAGGRAETAWPGRAAGQTAGPGRAGGRTAGTGGDGGGNRGTGGDGGGTAGNGGGGGGRGRKRRGRGGK